MTFFSINCRGRLPCAKYTTSMWWVNTIGFGKPVAGLVPSFSSSSDLPVDPEVCWTRIGSSCISSQDLLYG